MLYYLLKLFRVWIERNNLDLLLIESNFNYTRFIVANIFKNIFLIKKIKMTTI